MKKLTYILSTSLLLGFAVLGIVSCKDDSDEELALERQFKPSVIKTVNGETSVGIEWNPSLFTTAGEVEYVIEVSTDQTSFSPVAFTGTTKGVAVIITDNLLAIKQDYYARVKAVGVDGVEDSRWMVSGAFRILGEQFLLPVTSENTIDKSVRLTWKANPDLTKIVITPTGGAAVEVNLNDADKAVTLKQIDNLTAGTTYTAEIFAGAKSKGTQVFTTKSAIVGNVIDLRGISVAAKPNILVDTLADIASGSIVLLKRGSRYNVTAVYNFDKSVTIQSGLDFGTDLATIGLTSNFNLVPNSTIDSLVFKEVIIKGVRSGLGSYSADYILNASAVSTIGKIRLEGCTIKILRGLIRLQTGTTGTKITNYLVNNCVIDSVREYGVASVAAGSNAIANIRITNSTVSRARRFIVHSVAGNSSLAIENCTFNELPAGALAAANYFIDYGSANSGSMTMKNSIIGKVWDETATGTAVFGIRTGTSTTLSVTNTYSTSDFINNNNPVPGLSSYSGTAASLFTDPNNDNFKIKDANFIGKSSSGDPRWR